MSPGDSAALSAALVPILTDRSLAEEMGHAGRRRAIAAFSETQCVENFLKLYGELQPGTTVKEELSKYRTA